MKIYRPITVVVGVLFVLLGGIVRLADPGQVLDDPTRKLEHGAIGAPISGRDFTLTVTRVKLAKSVLKSESDGPKNALTTDGVFVAVEFDLAGRHLPKTVGNLSLVTAGGATYKPTRTPIISTASTPAAGFTESQVAVFEANPDDLAGLTLRVTPTLFISYYTVDYAIDLGIPSAGVAADLVARASTATGREYVMPNSQLRVTS